jgi:membrane protein
LIRKAWAVIKDFAVKMGKQNISAHAASTAFFFFLSVVPMLMVLSTVIPYTSLTREDLVEAITEVLPDAADPLAVSLVNEVYDKSGGVLSLAILTTIWSAGRGVLALIRGLNAINGVEEKRNYFHVRLVATAYTIVMLLVVILSLFIMVFGNQLVHVILKGVASIFAKPPHLGTLNTVLMNMRFLVIWVVLTFLFSVVYAYVPNRKLKLRDQTTGAAFAAVVWSIFSWGFSLYVDTTGSYSIYGSLSIIIIIMVWLYFCMYIVMVGAYMNLYFQPVNEMLGKRKTKEK